MISFAVALYSVRLILTSSPLQCMTSNQYEHYTSSRYLSELTTKILNFNKIILLCKYRDERCPYGDKFILFIQQSNPHTQYCRLLRQTYCSSAVRALICNWQSKEILVDSILSMTNIEWLSG